MKTDKTDISFIRTVDSLTKYSREKSAPIWRDLAERLEKPTRKRVEVNISTIDRNSSEGDILAVPGKVLGAGTIGKNVTVGALDFSASAKKQIEDAGGRTVPLIFLAEENPSGKNVKILG